MKSNYHFKLEDLNVYQKATDFGELVNTLVMKFPKHELYALSSQFRRAADSIALNISEEYPRSDPQFIKHIHYVIYSSNECVSCSSKAYRRDYISAEENENNRMYLSELTKMLSSFRNKIQERNN
ncbi:S23 ribosomal protein [Aequorivita sublithincola DSM 14238]|uniref:S23 ribosomal protein n=1 Tax=Aequorivita sublithincola (strain DSM 14238 / LMG 21431 / ACAM 643 / 9-3) TaxID=746697 RepID=I3YW89_AEQSU|nr:four helix bundle protein [Aequorivita sublithincola]AFL81257.1 S23 ribosomal protein [Aequorivita sublithincola DSM 14238]